MPTTKNIPSFFFKKNRLLQQGINTNLSTIASTNALSQSGNLDKTKFQESKANFLPTFLPSTDNCADIEIIDLRNIAGFPQTDDLTVCGAADTLSFIVFTGDLGTIRGFELTVDLPDGIEYAGWEFTQLGATDITVTKKRADKPRFFIDGISGDSLVIANIGIRANCNVDKTKMLFVNFSYEYTFIDTAGVSHNCEGTFTPNLEYNSAIHEPVLNMLAPLSPEEVTLTDIGTAVCQEVKISQDGLSAYVDSFTFQINGLDLNSGEVILDDISANGIAVDWNSVSYDMNTQVTSVKIDNSFFATNTLANGSATQMNTNEIITLSVCYKLAQCPTSLELPFIYNAYFGCQAQICEQTSQASFIIAQPEGALFPTATSNLGAGGIEICGTPGLVSVSLNNPNTDTEQNVYTDIKIGFKTCEKPNLEITGVMMGGNNLPDSLYHWEGEEISIDLSKNQNPSLGLEDYDSDGFYDDLRGGNSLSATVEISVSCGSDTESCVNILCKDVQFFVEGKTNCGVGFKKFPTPDMFNLIYGATAVSNPTEMEFSTSGIFGYDFGKYSNVGSPLVGTDSSQMEVIFCYTFEKENIEDCPSGATNFLEVDFSGDIKFAQDLQFVPNSDSISIDSGLTYTAIGSATMTKPDVNSALLVLNGGSNEKNVCYKYTIEMDSCICSPVGYFTAQQRVISGCSDCVGSCEIVKACRAVTFRADPECTNCDCIVQNGHVSTERINLGYTDKTMTTKHTRQSLIDAGASIDLTRFVVGDTLQYQDYWVIKDTLALQNLSYWNFSWSFVENGTANWVGIEKLELLLDAHGATFEEMKFSKVGGARVDVDLAAIVGCQTDNVTSYGGVWNYTDRTPWGNAIDHIPSHNSSTDYGDNNALYLYLWNYDKVEDCGGSNARFTGGNCLDEMLTAYNVAVGDTIHFKWQAPLIKNPHRAALEKLGMAPAATNVARIFPSLRVYEHDVVSGNDAYCATYVDNACVETAPIYLDNAGEIDAVTRMDLNTCGGTITHEFTVRDLPGPVGDEWFTQEYRPFLNLREIDALIRAPLAYCANAQVTNATGSFSVTVDSTYNLFCNPVVGYSEHLCAVDSNDVGKIMFDLYGQGMPALGVGLDNCDTLRLTYDLCMICPGDIPNIDDYELVYDWSYVNTPLNKNSFEHSQYRCTHDYDVYGIYSICDSFDFESQDDYWALLGFDSLMNKENRGSDAFFLTDNRDPLDPVSIDNKGANLLASASPGTSEEIQQIVICNSDVDDTAMGVGGSITLPASVRLVNIYADTTGTPTTLSTNLVSDDGATKTYSITLANNTLTPNACDTFYIGTTLLYCPEPGSPAPIVCVGTFSGCAPAEVKAALAASGGCGESEVCYAYTSGEVGLQSEWFNPLVNPTLCDTVEFFIRVKNVKQLVLTDLEPMFDLPNGLTPITGSWEVSYPGGAVAPLNWISIGTDPDVVSGNTYGYSDDALWSSKINADGLQGVSESNATLDSNKVAFKFKAITSCDIFLSGSKLLTETTAADPCTTERVRSGFVESPPVIINQANPIDYAELLLVSDPEVLNCEGTINSFGITAINTGAKSTSDSVQMCITIPEELTYTNGSLNFTSPADFVPNDITQTTIGTGLELCFNAPKVNAYGSFSIQFDAMMKNTAACGDIRIGTDIKSFEPTVTCTPGPPSSCGVFVQNSLNTSVNIELNPPFIAEEMAVFTDCTPTADSVKLYYEYIINHNGPNAINQAYTVSFYEDWDGNKNVNTAIDNLLGASSNTFSVNDGESITISGEINVAAAQSCPVLFEVVYATGCNCDRTVQYFDNIKFKNLRNYQEPITMCAGSCFDLEVCGFVDVIGDSIIGATGVPYELSLDWEGLGRYTLPTPGLNLDSLTYESMTNNSIFPTTQNLLVSEHSYEEKGGYLIAKFPYPVNVSSLFIGGGNIAGWGNIIHVYTNTCYSLEYSSDGVNWTNSALDFTGPDAAAIQEEVLPTPIAAQYWRMSSCETPANWATSEFRFEGKNVPFQMPPITQTGNTVTVCLPEGVGEERPWQVAFSTGTGNCEVTETIDIWKSTDPAFTIEGDTAVCGSECIDLEIIIPNDASEGMTVSWTPATLIDDPNVFEIVACNLTGDVTFEATITYNGGECQEVVQFPVKHYPVNSINVVATNVIECFNDSMPPILTADLGWELYTWYEVSSGSEILAYSSTSNVFETNEGGTYLVKASSSNVLCPAISETTVLPTTKCIRDYGDLQDTANGTSANNYETTHANTGPNHIIINGLYLGATVDGETDGFPDNLATGDDYNGIGDDEDGVTIDNHLNVAPNGTIRLPLTVTNTTGTIANLEAWIDWNGDGAFDGINEMVTNLADTGTGDFPEFLLINIPADAQTGSLLGFRVRLSHTDNMTPYGGVTSGEVEDYLLGVECAQVVCEPAETDLKKE